MFFIYQIIKLFYTPKTLKIIPQVEFFPLIFDFVQCFSKLSIVIKSPIAFSSFVIANIYYDVVSPWNTYEKIFIYLE